MPHCWHLCLWGWWGSSGYTSRGMKYNRFSQMNGVDLHQLRRIQTCFPYCWLLFMFKNVNMSGTWVLAASGSVKTCLKIPKIQNHAFRILVLVLWLLPLFLARVLYMGLCGTVVEWGWMLCLSSVSRLQACSYGIPPLSLLLEALTTACWVSLAGFKLSPGRSPLVC